MTRDRNFYRTFLKLMTALMMQQAVVLSVNLADNVMLGSYSETALSGVAAVNQIQFILQQLVFALSNGMVVVATQYWGQKKTGPIKRLLSIAFRWEMVVAFGLLAVVSFLPHTVVGFFTNDEAIIREGMSYLSIVRFSYFFFAATTVLLGAMRTVEKVKIALYVSIMALIVNVSINYCLIQGHFGFPELGVRGAAIGTLTARILECIVVSVYVFGKDKILSVKLSDFRIWDKTLFGDFIRVDTPMLISSFLWGANTALQTVILGHMSSNAIAAHSISSTIFLFLKVMAVGSASAASVIIGKTVGEGNRQKIREYFTTLQVIFLSIGLFLCVVLFAIRIPLLSLYNLTPETYDLAKAFMIINALVLMFTSFQMPVNTGVIPGGGDTKYIFYLDLICIWGLVMPLAFLAAFYLHLSPIIVVICLNIDQPVKCIPAFLYGNSLKWVRTLTREDQH